MANISFERLYELYISEQSPLARDNMLASYVLNNESDTGVLFEAKEYLLNNIKSFPNYFRSEENTEEDAEKIRNLSKVFSLLAYAVDNYVSDLHLDAIDKLKAEDSDTEKYIDDLYEDSVMIEPQHLFKVSPDRIQKAYKAYYNEISEVSPENVVEAINLIKRVQNDGAIEKIYGDNNADNTSIDSLLFALYDHYNKDKTTFSTSFSVPYDASDEYFLNSYFHDIKHGQKVGPINFTRYRPSLIFKREIMLNINKVIFARNLLSYKESGIMPSPNGLIDFYVDEEEADNLIDRLGHIYNKSFNNTAFKKMQSSPIFDIDKALLKPELLEKAKAGLNGNSLALGMLLSSDSSIVCEYVRQFYLLHIYIDDVTNDKCKYEIQLNAIPEACMDARVQLMRLDNWERLQSHKNIGNKLETTTHVHLYNHLDLLRGKTNGEFDIAHNFKDDSTSFDDALKTFTIMMGANETLAKNIIMTAEKAKKTALKRVEREL